jgi:hypothetical protein
MRHGCEADYKEARVLKQVAKTQGSTVSAGQKRQRF